MSARAFTPAILYMTGGLVIWGARFLLAYAFTAIACTRGGAEAQLFGMPLIPLTLSGMTAVAVAGALVFVAYALVRLRRTGEDDGDTAERFMHQSAALVAALGIVAMIWETVPAYTIPICGG